MPRKQGAARQAEIIRSEWDEKRPEGWADGQRLAYARAVAKKKGLERVIAGVQWAMDFAAKDPGVPPEYAREQVIRAGQSLAKVIDPQRLIKELDTEQAKALDRIEELEAEIRVLRQPRGSSREAPAQMQ